VARFRLDALNILIFNDHRHDNGHVEAMPRTQRDVRIA
jgi:hypothetical protein